MKKILLVFLIAIASCKPLPPEEKEFAEIVDGFPVLDLPAKFPEWDREMDPISSEKTKTFINKFFEKNYIGLWGRVFPRESLYYLIGTQPDDQGTPFLFAFDRTGKIITKAALLSGEYISADISSSTDNQTILSDDMSFVETDSLRTSQLNPEGTDAIRGTEVCRVTVRKFQINKDGQVSLLSSDSSSVKTGR
ncbi:MAG TPA: hypothetical protein VFE50_12650 [Cyclobacteriaceae bacterium]|nr:hypothetical protein [Cyclobacteriaceae bacterium]